MDKKKAFNILGLTVLLCIVINGLSSYFYTSIDLTEDKKYSLKESSKNLLYQQNEPILIEVLYSGDFPAGYERLENAAKELLRNFRNHNPNLRYTFFDPLEGLSPEETNQRLEVFSKMGLLPFPITYETDKFIAIQAFPYAILTKGNSEVVINLIDGSVTGPNMEENLNKSVALLEYKFVNAIQKINQQDRNVIAFLEGHGEYGRKESYKLESEMRRYNFTTRINLDTLDVIDNRIDILIINAPKKKFEDRELFAIDDYVMNGGNIIWLVEPLAINNDSIRIYGNYVPPSNELNLNNLFFNYGVRYQPNAVLDMNCAKIPMATSSPSGTPQYQLFDWYYHPVIDAGSGGHLITNNIGRMSMHFPGTIDTVRTDGQLSKTILLHSSEYSKAMTTPFSATFEILKYPMEADKFSSDEQAVCVLIEGKFPSYFAGRLSKSYSDILEREGKSFNTVGHKRSIQLFVSDADFLITNFDRQQKPLPIGYDQGERILYEGNETFIVNAIEYMEGNGALLESKAKSVKLRLLDTIKAKAEKSKWQTINLILPLLILFLFGIFFNYYRKRKYSK